MMEVMHRGVEEDVAVEQPENVDITSSSSEEDDEIDSKPSSGEYKNQEEKEKNEISENSVHFDKNEGTTLQLSFPGKNLEDVDIPKLVNAVTNNQTIANVEDNIESALNASTSNPTLTDKNNVVTRDGASKNARIAIEEESDDEVIELEFERAVEQVHTHMYSPYCPNCKSQITKVILRRKKHRPRLTADEPVNPPPTADEPVNPRPTLDETVNPQPTADEPVNPQPTADEPVNPQPTADEPVNPQPTLDEPGNLFGCLSCLSIFTLSGDCLNPLRIFGPSKKPEITQVAEEQESVAGGPAAVVGSTNIKQDGDGFDLFGMFRKKRNNQKALGPQGTTRNDEESSTANSGGALAVSSLHDPLLTGHPSPDHKDEAAASSGTGGSQKPDDADTTQPRDPDVPGDDVAIDIRDGVGTGQQEGISGERRSKSVEILKCIIHGGLMELIASLSVVSSAAASDATTLNIIALGVASLISGLFVFSHSLMGLKNENASKGTDRYQELLGTRGHFLFHATFAILSFLVFGIIPPVVYGFTFRESDNKNYKMLALVVASFACVFILAIGKAYTKRSQKFSEYVRTVLYYITMAISASGVAYAAGDLIKMLMHRLGWFKTNQTVPSFVPDAISATPTWASY